MCRDYIGDTVLILVVVEDGLVQHSKHSTERMSLSINPNCSGQWSRTFSFAASANVGMSLNPCCSGRWSSTATVYARSVLDTEVLILIVVDDGLVHLRSLTS